MGFYYISLIQMPVIVMPATLYTTTIYIVCCYYKPANPLPSKSLVSITHSCSDTRGREKSKQHQIKMPYSAPTACAQPRTSTSGRICSRLYPVWGNRASAPSRAPTACWLNSLRKRSCCSKGGAGCRESCTTARVETWAMIQNTYLKELID